MKMPAFLAGDSLARLLQGAAAGAALAMVVGFGWGGWVLGDTASKMAEAKSTAAVVKVMTPLCVQRFQQQANLPAQWAAFKKEDSWQRDTFVEEGGFATPIGATEANQEVGQACANALDKILEAQESKDKQADKSS